jgi:hypothetical protein
VTQQDLSSPQHRLDNLTNMRFVRAYAQIRHHVFTDDRQDETTDFLRGYIGEMDRQIAHELQLPETTLVGRLVDLGRDLCEWKSATDGAE